MAIMTRRITQKWWSCHSFYVWLWRVESPRVIAAIICWVVSKKRWYWLWPLTNSARCSTSIWWLARRTLKAEHAKFKVMGLGDLWYFVALEQLSHVTWVRPQVAYKKYYNRAGDRPHGKLQTFLVIAFDRKFILHFKQKHLNFFYPVPTLYNMFLQLPCSLDFKPETFLSYNRIGAAWT